MIPTPPEAGMEDAKLITGLREPYTTQDELFQHVLDTINAERHQAADRLAVMSVEAREKLAAWMIEHSFATGHGNTIDDLLIELSWQVRELRARAALKGPTP